ncbi:hypothetical protein BRARA_J02257 [Brassica rapa]|uniref:Uncharacterized protein n=1 Tax=Brassica campestris TaxID=3711 RepID=A0A397XMK1_BRACM|nr:hypothetical protein BRARA_J02257 [Brassica rapa]
MMMYRRRRGIDNFSKMRAYLKLGDSKGDEVPEDTIKAVADTLRTSSALKVSEDGEFTIEGSGKTWKQDQRVRLQHIDTSGYLHSHNTRTCVKFKNRQKICIWKMKS